MMESTSNKTGVYTILLLSGTFFPALLLAGCGGGSGPGSVGPGGADARPIGEVPDGGAGADGNGCWWMSEEEQLLVEEVIQDRLVEATHVATQSSATTLAYAISLAGTDVAYTGTIPAQGQCTGPSVSPPVCVSASLPPGTPSDPFLQAHDKCLQLGCEEQDVALVKVYMTMRPTTDPDQLHPFSYDTTIPEGMGIYDPNPQISWEIDLSTAGEVEVSANFFEDISIVPVDGSEIDISHMTSVEATSRSGDITEVTMELGFPALVREDAVLTLTMDSDSQVMGTMTMLGREMARISGTFTTDTPLTVTWLECQ